jgi:hypothetical protein
MCPGLGFATSKAICERSRHKKGNQTAVRASESGLKDVASSVPMYCKVEVR